MKRPWKKSCRRRIVACRAGVKASTCPYSCGAGNALDGRYPLPKKILLWTILTFEFNNKRENVHFFLKSVTFELLPLCYLTAHTTDTTAVTTRRHTMEQKFRQLFNEFQIRSITFTVSDPMRLEAAVVEVDEPSLYSKAFLKARQMICD